MKQVIQEWPSGKIRVTDVPEPVLQPGHVLVQTAFSAISSGTERQRLRAGKAGVLSLAKERPDLVRQVMGKVRSEGFISTARKVFQRLTEPSPLGYSISGRVVAVGAGVQGLNVGDLIAGAGAGFANHAEKVVVPVNLCVKIPDGVSLQSACWATIAAIALHGVREAEVRLGDRVGVIGTGLLGQMAGQVLKSTGSHPVAIDLNEERLSLARSLWAELALNRNQDDLFQVINHWTQGFGLDAVLVCAASRGSNDPLVLAGQLSRDRGTVMLLGDVPMDVPRPLFYEKELNLKVSRSYGPGRYDDEYETKGIDYPIGYVRWTEGRNLEEALTLMKQGDLRVEPLVTHRFSIDRSDEAYEALEKFASKTLGILLEYPNAVPVLKKLEKVGEIARGRITPQQDRIGIGVIGVGNFATSVLIPALKSDARVRLVGSCAATGLRAEHARKSFGFEYGTTRFEDILNDASIGAVVIATRHHLHASMAIEALEQGKHVFVEKPLATSQEQLQQIIEVYKKSSGSLMVGFNRRFSSLTRELKSKLSPHVPLSLTYRVNAGLLPAGHWLLDPDQGGGRLIGEGCHFVDLAIYLTSSQPLKVQVRAWGDQSQSFVINLEFENRSQATVFYVCEGNPTMPKERLEVFQGGRSFVLDDYRSLKIYSTSRPQQIRLWRQDKGHAAQLRGWVDHMLNAKDVPIQFDELVTTTQWTLKAFESRS